MDAEDAELIARTIAESQHSVQLSSGPNFIKIGGLKLWQAYARDRFALAPTGPKS